MGKNVRLLPATAVSLALAIGFYVLKIPFLQYVNGDFANTLTSAYISRHGNSEFSRDYIWGGSRLTLGMFNNALFRDEVDNRSLAQLLCARSTTRLTVIAFFLFFLGCFLLTRSLGHRWAFGFLLMPILMMGFPGYLEGWGIRINTAGLNANYYNCLVPLFLFWLMHDRTRLSSFVPVLLIPLANMHPVSAMAFATVTMIYAGVQKKWTTCAVTVISTLIGFAVAWRINTDPRDQAAFAMTPAFIDFLTTRLGARFFIFPWDCQTPFPSHPRTYIYIASQFLRLYGIAIGIGAVLIVLGWRRPRIREKFPLLITICLLPFIAIAAALLSRALIFLIPHAAFISLETVRIERLTWPLLLTVVFFLGAELYEEGLPAFPLKKVVPGALAAAAILWHFSIDSERPVLSVVKNTAIGLAKHPFHPAIAQPVTSAGLVENFETAKKLAAMGLSNLYAPGDVFLRITMKWPVYFSHEDGGIAIHAGQKAAEEWIRRYRLLDKISERPEDIPILLNAERELGGLVLPYQARFETLPVKMIRLGRYVLMTRTQPSSRPRLLTIE